MSEPITNTPDSIPVPVTVTVDTSVSVPPLVENVHLLSASQAGFTNISNFTFTADLTGTVYSIIDNFEPKISNTKAVWDFGDGYTLSAANSTTTTHRYRVPGIYKVSMYFFNEEGNTHLNTVTKSVSVYNYVPTNVAISNNFVASVSAAQFPAGTKNNSFNAGVSASWQDIPEDGKFTLYLTASGSKAKPYDTKSKYAHLVPYNAFYNPQDGNLINSVEGLNFKLNNQYYVVNPSTNKIEPILEDKVEEFTAVGMTPYLLGATVSTFQGYDNTSTNSAGVTSMRPGKPYSVSAHDIPAFIYYDDIPNIDPGVRLLFKLDTSKHKVRNFYVDGIDSDINSSGLTFLETNQVGAFVGNTTTEIGYPIKISKPTTTRLSFTSTGMKEMSGIQYKRQGDKFQLFIALADRELNIAKYYPQYLWSSSQNPAQDNQFYLEWTDGTTTTTSNISSISTNKFPYDTSTGKTNLSSFLYTNINPLSAGTWTLNVTGRIDSFTSAIGVSGYNAIIDYDGSGPLGPVSLTASGGNIIEGSYTFTVLPSTNDVEIYKINEDIDYSQTIKGYRFQSFLHEYDNLFDGIFTSFVGEASSSPTVFGKTVFEKIANFVANNNDVDYCNLDNLQSFYDFFNEDIDIVLPTPPPELKRLYDLFSIKITKLLGGYEQNNERLTTDFYTNSANGRNVDFNNKIDTSTYTVTAYTNIVARQKFNNEFVLIKPQKIASLSFQTANELWDLTTTNLNFATTTGWQATVSDQINETGSSPISGWVLTGSVAGHNPYTGTPATNNLFQAINAKSNSSYKVTVTVASCTAGTLRVIIGQHSNGVALPQTGGVTNNGTHSVTITNTGIYDTLSLEVSQDFNGNIDNIIIQELISNQYPLSAYNKYSNWGWSLDTSVSGASGLDSFYDFYPYTTYDTTSADENIKNSIVDFNNTYTSITRGNSSLSANWDNTGGIVYKNVDYQIRKGLNI